MNGCVLGRVYVSLKARRELLRLGVDHIDLLMQYVGDG